MTVAKSVVMDKLKLDSSFTKSSKVNVSFYSEIWEMLLGLGKMRADKKVGLPQSLESINKIAIS